MEKAVCVFCAIIVGVVGLMEGGALGGLVGALIGYCLGAKIVS